jgi:indole-3-glycerol phosphate synthase
VSVLDDIVATKRAELALFLQGEALDALQKAVEETPPPRDFEGALRPGPGRLAVIGELKRRSPSKGDLAPDLDAVATAKSYETGGAAALSVLTDQTYFGGSAIDLQDAKAASSIPVLRKDFTIDPSQIYETRAIGADAVLLIAAALPDDGLLRDLHELAGEVGLAALVEAHDEPELDRALAVGARIVGVNARDLGTFGEDLSVGERLARRIPRDVIAVAESAVRTADDAQRMASAGYDAVLVGEALVRSGDPAALVAAMSSKIVEPRGT